MNDSPSKPYHQDPNTGTWVVPQRGWECPICCDFIVRTCGNQNPQVVEMECCERRGNFSFMCKPCLDKVLQSNDKCPICTCKLLWVRTAIKKNELVHQVLSNAMRTFLVDHFPEGVPDDTDHHEYIKADDNNDQASQASRSANQAKEGELLKEFWWDTW